MRFWQPSKFQRSNTRDFQYFLGYSEPQSCDKGLCHISLLTLVSLESLSPRPKDVKQLAQGQGRRMLIFPVHMYMYACMWKPEDNARRHPSVDVLIVFKTGFLTGLELRVSPGICMSPPPWNQSQHTPASHSVQTEPRLHLLLSVNIADNL